MGVRCPVVVVIADRSQPTLSVCPQIGKITADDFG
jgi:hypothetical protein